MYYAGKTWHIQFKRPTPPRQGSPSPPGHRRRWNARGGISRGYVEASKRPFPNYLQPLFQNEAWCSTIAMKMSLIYMWMKTYNHMKGSALGLALKMRSKVTRKWPIDRRIIPRAHAIEMILCVFCNWIEFPFNHFQAVTWIQTFLFERKNDLYG